MNELDKIDSLKEILQRLEWNFYDATILQKQKMVEARNDSLKKCFQGRAEAFLEARTMVQNELKKIQ